jgi:hypothetical protein
MITGDDYEYAPKLVPDKCCRLFWIGNDAWECMREPAHGGSCTANGAKDLDGKTRLFFTVSWHQEPIA